MALLRKVCLRGWPLVGIWELRLLESLHHSLSTKSGLRHLICANTMVYADTCFPPGRLEIWCVWGSRCLHDQLHENLGHRVCHEITEVRRDWGRRVRPLGPNSGFPPDFPHVPFSFVDFALYTLTLINHSCEYKYILIPVSPPRNPWNLGVT